MQNLDILSEDPLKQIWLHLSLRESKKMAHQLIALKAEKAHIVLPDDLLNEKAKGLAYCSVPDIFRGVRVGRHQQVNQVAQTC
jgi:hypothetical protein